MDLIEIGSEAVSADMSCPLHLFVFSFMIMGVRFSFYHVNVLVKLLVIDFKCQCS